MIITILHSVLTYHTNFAVFYGLFNIVKLFILEWNVNGEKRLTIRINFEQIERTNRIQSRNPQNIKQYKYGKHGPLYTPEVGSNA